MGAGFNALAAAGIQNALNRQHEERQAQLDNIANSGLTPEQQRDAIQQLYAKDPSALKRHIENLAGRLIGRKPQPVQPAYAAQSVTSQAAPLKVGNQTLPAPAPVTVSYPGARTHSERLAQDLSGGKTKEQQALDLYKAQLDARLGENAQTLQGKVAAIRKIQADPSLSEDDKRELMSLYGIPNYRPTTDEMKRQDYQAALMGGYRGSYEQWLAEQSAKGHQAGAIKVGTFGGFLTAAYGLNPTPKQYMEARRLWAASGAGTTVGTHTITVPQTDGSIKLITVETSSSKNFGPLPTLPGETSAPAPRKSGGGSGGNSRSQGWSGASPNGRIVGGKQTPAEVKANEQADQAEEAYAQARADLKNPTPIGDTGLLIGWVRGHIAGAGRLTNVEIGLALKSGSYGTRMMNSYDRATSGTLDPAYRKQLVDDLGTTAGIMRSQADRYKQPAPRTGAASGNDLSSRLDAALGGS